MKKTLFIAVAVAGFSQFSFAQEAARMTPAPTQAEVDRDAQAKAASKQEVAAKHEVAAKSTKTNQADAEYKKMGLNDNQIAAVNKTNSHYDARRTAINNDKKLTAEEKKNQAAAVEAERNASLQKRLGEDNYKKYTQLNAAPADAPSKKAAKPTAKPKPAN